MKKILIAALVLLCCVAFSACSATGAETTPSAGNSSSASSDVTPAKVAACDESTIKTLVNGNNDCMENIFQMTDLPTIGNAIKDNIYQVDTAKFKDYAAFEAYIKSIYNTETAKMLLNDYPYEGTPKYINIDGKLCLDKDRSSAKGYFVDWSNYTVKITKSDDTSCEFALTASITEPGATAEEYNVTGSAVYENGKWLLSKIIY